MGIDVRAPDDVLTALRSGRHEELDRLVPVVYGGSERRNAATTERLKSGHGG
jgi:hypothetical protein